MSLACLLLNHTPAGICTFKVLQSAFTREPRSSCISLNEIGEKVNEISEPGSKKTYVPFQDSCLDCAQPLKQHSLFGITLTQQNTVLFLFGP